jgi:hypothetical protein
MTEKKRSTKRREDTHAAGEPENGGSLPSAPGDEEHRAAKVNPPRREEPTGPPHEPRAASRPFIPPELRAADAPVPAKPSVPMHERAAPGVEDNASTPARLEQFSASHPPRTDGGDRLPKDMRVTVPPSEDAVKPIEVNPAIGPASADYNLDQLPGFVKKGERVTGAPERKEK